MPELRSGPRPLTHARSIAVACAALLACAAPADKTSADTAPAASAVPASPPFQTVSLLGDTLRAFPLAPDVRTRYEAQLGEARRAYEHTPSNVDSIIWYARRLGYLGQLRESIEIFTRGVALFPDNPWLYRHRGHRYISVRDFPAAVRDLERAAELVKGRPDEVEPDGQSNAQNTPIGTLHSNIGYHLALAHYLLGDFPAAARTAQREVNAATNLTALEKGLKANKRVTVRRLSGVQHSFQTPAAELIPNADGTVDPVVSTVLLDTVRNWVLQQTGQ